MILLENIKSFALKMSTMRRYLSLEDKLYYKYHKEGWFLEAVNIYCEAVTCLMRDLNRANLRARGFLSFREYMMSYVDSEYFRSFDGEYQKSFKADLSEIRYCILIKDNCIKVRKYDSEVDYSTEVKKHLQNLNRARLKTIKLSFQFVQA